MVNFWMMFSKVISILGTLAIFLLSASGFWGIILTKGEVKAICYDFYYNRKMSKEREKLIVFLRDVVLIFLLLVWITIWAMILTSESIEIAFLWLLRGTFPYVLYLAVLFTRRQLKNRAALERECRYLKDREQALEERVENYRAANCNLAKERDEWKVKYEELNKAFEEFKASVKESEKSELSEKGENHDEEIKISENCGEKCNDEVCDADVYGEEVSDEDVKADSKEDEKWPEEIG